MLRLPVLCNVALSWHGWCQLQETRYQLDHQSILLRDNETSDIDSQRPCYNRLSM